MRIRDRWQYSAIRARFWNWRSRRTLRRGRRDIPARAGDQVRSRLPVLRGRINPATGRQHREDVRLGRTSDQSLARWKTDLARTASQTRELQVSRSGKHPLRERGRSR